jgi:tRNA(Ile)-lysidine synthase
LALNAGWRLSLQEAQPDLAAARASANSYEAWLDADAAGEQLSLRQPRPGDKLQPLGVDGTQTLADLFTNAKLPRRARAAWPLLCAGDQIAWVPGHRLAHPFRLQDKTRRALRASLTRAA